MKLQNRIFLGLMAGVIVGVVANASASGRLTGAILALAPFGTAFIRLITMVVVPLVVASLMTGIASLGDVGRLGRIGGKTLAYFIVTTALAAATGLIIARIAGLGDRAPAGLGEPPAGSSAPQMSPEGTAPGDGTASLVQTLVNAVPQNPFASAAQGDLLPLMIAVCIFGAAATVIRGEGRRIVVSFFEGLNDLSLVVIGWVMHLAPAAVFVLIASAVARSGIDLIRSLLQYALVVVLALAVHATIVLVVVLRVWARIGVVAFVRQVSDALLLAFSTAASNAVLPVSMAAAKERVRIPNEIVSFVLPLGTIVNKNGSAVYKAVTAVFLAQLYGLHLGGGKLVTIILVSTIAAFAGAGVPASSLVTTMIVLNAIGLGPHAASGIALVAGIDRPLDMCRTTVNTLSNLVGAAVIARSEGEILR